MFLLLFNVICVYCWQFKWINEDFLSYSLEFNFMQTLLLDFLVGSLRVVPGTNLSKIVHVAVVWICPVLMLIPAISCYQYGMA
ncbi:hypothetical protein ACFX14_029282 [Malus domestica]